MTKQGTLSIEKENIFRIIRENIYDEKDAFIRELLSNGRDAAVKHQSLTGASDETGEYRLDIVIDEAAQTIRFEDNGLGMDAGEVDRYINNVAFSGAVDFVRQQQGEAAERSPIIGHFGLGFYSVFMVSDHVTIDTLSWKEGAEPVHWTCTGSKMSFSMETGTRSTRGTTVTVALDSLEFTNPYQVFKAACRYCCYLPTPVFVTVENENVRAGQKPFGTRQANFPVPVWLKDPSGLTDEDYINCYHETFGLIQEPAAWINLYNKELGVRGVIWLRDLDAAEGTLEGNVKLYSRHVFIADNVHELIPDFLLVQYGVVDLETLPLNVSRASIRNDGYARAVYTWIVEQVGSQIEKMCREAPERYREKWPVIGPFVKLGYLKNKKFRPFARRSMLYETSLGEFITLEEYSERRGGEKEIYYTSDPDQQAAYLAMFEQCGIPVLKMLHMVDQPYIRQLELEDRELHFRRIDSDVLEILIMKEDPQNTEVERKKKEEILAPCFGGQIGQEKLQIRVESLVSDEVPALMILDESTRRMQDTLTLYGLAEGADLSKHRFQQKILLLNARNRLIQRICREPKSKTAGLLAKQIYDLTRLGQEGLSDRELHDFVHRSTEIMVCWEESMPEKDPAADSGPEQ